MLLYMREGLTNVNWTVKFEGGAKWWSNTVGFNMVSIPVSSQTKLFPVAVWKAPKRAQNPRWRPLESISGPCRVMNSLTAQTAANVVVR